MKKMICSLLTVAVVFSIPLTSFAASIENESVVKSNIITVREDVTREEAIRDASVLYY